MIDVLFDFEPLPPNPNFMSSPSYMTSIQIDIFNDWKLHSDSSPLSNHTKIYYDLVELTPDQIQVIVKMVAILSRGIYDSRLPRPLEDQTTGELKITPPE